MWAGSPQLENPGFCYNPLLKHIRVVSLSNPLLTLGLSRISLTLILFLNVTFHYRNSPLLSTSLPWMGVRCRPSHTRLFQFPSLPQVTMWKRCRFLCFPHVKHRCGQWCQVALWGRQCWSPAGVHSGAGCFLILNKQPSRCM